MANEGNREFSTPTLGDLARAFSATARQSLTTVALVWTALTVSYVVFDAVVPAENQLRLQSVLGIASTVVAYALTRRLLAATAQPGAPVPAGRVGAYIGLGIMTGIGTVVGLILLIVPGLILSARWLLAAPILLAEDTTIGKAISRSWDATSTNWVKLVVAQVLVAIPFLVGIGIVFVTELGAATDIVEAPSLASSIAQNAGTSLFTVASVVLSVAAYRAIVPGHDQLAEVFA